METFLIQLLDLAGKRVLQRRYFTIKIFLVELKVSSGAVLNTHVLPSLSSSSVAPKNSGYYVVVIEDVFHPPLSSNMTIGMHAKYWFELIFRSHPQYAMTTKSFFSKIIFSTLSLTFRHHHLGAS